MSTRSITANGLESEFATATTESKVRIRNLCAALLQIARKETGEPEVTSIVDELVVLLDAI